MGLCFSRRVRLFSSWCGVGSVIGEGGGIRVFISRSVIGAVFVKGKSVGVLLYLFIDSKTGCGAIIMT